MPDKKYIDFAPGSYANTQIILTADPITSALGKVPLSFIGLEYAINNNNALTANRTINLATFKLTFSNGSLAASSYGLGAILGTPTFGLAVDASGNIIEVALATTIAANSGLTMTGSTIQLGSATNAGNPLLHDTYINTSGSFILNVYGARNVAPVFTVTNTGNGNSSYFESTGSAYATIHCYNKNGGTAIGAYADAGGQCFYGNQSSSDTNTALMIMQLLRITTGTAASGIGMNITFGISNSGGGQVSANKIISKLTTVTPAAEVSQFIIRGLNAAVEADLLTINGNGQLQFNKYGSGTFTGTAAKWLAVTATGLLIEEAAPGGGSVTADNGLNMSTATNVQLGGTLTTPTTITGGSNLLTFTGSGTGSNATVNITNTSTGHALISTANGSGYGVFGSGFRGVYGSTNSGSGSGVEGIASTAGNAFTGSSTTGTTLVLSQTPTGTNDVSNIISLQRFTSSGSGFGANGIGAAIAISAPTTTSTAGQAMGSMLIKWADATHASRTAQFEILLVNNASSSAAKFIVKGTGYINIPTDPGNYANNAAATGAGLVNGDIYRNGDVVQIVHA